MCPVAAGRNKKRGGRQKGQRKEKRENTDELIKQGVKEKYQGRRADVVIA